MWKKTFKTFHQLSRFVGQPCMLIYALFDLIGFKIISWQSPFLLNKIFKDSNQINQSKNQIFSLSNEENGPSLMICVFKIVY